MSETTPKTAELDPARAREIVTRARVDYYRSGAFVLGVKFDEWLELMADQPEHYDELLEAGDRFLDLVVGKLAVAIAAASKSPASAAKLHDELVGGDGGAQRQLAALEVARMGLGQRPEPEPIMRGGPT